MPAHRSVSFLIATACCVTLSACSAGSVPQASAIPASSVTRAAISSAVTRPDGANRTILYVANNSPSVGTLTETLNGASAPFLTTSSGIDRPSFVTVDNSGVVYVANEATNTISEYGPGSGTPFLTISGLDGVTALTTDKFNQLYVGLYNAGSGSVEVFAVGGTVPLRTITNGIGLATGLAVDAADTLYVLNSQTNVSVYAKNTVDPARIITNGVTVPQALALDSSGNLFVSNILPTTVTEYAPGASSPSRTLTNGITYGVQLATDSAGNLYVANYPDGSGQFDGKGNVTVYGPASTTPSETIDVGTHRPRYIAVDSRDRLYIANIPDDVRKPGFVALYLFGRTVPERNIRSVDNPDAIAVH